MKVAYILPSFPVLYATFSVNQVYEAVKEGIDVRIFSIRDGNPGVKHDRSVQLSGRVRYFGEYLFPRRSLAGRLTARVLTQASAKFARLNRLLIEPRLRALLSSGVGDEYFQELRWSAIPLQRIARTLEEEGFDLIHAAFGNVPATAALALSRLTGLPFTFESHAYDLYVAFSRPAEKISGASRVFTISEYNKRHFVEQYHCPPEKITVFRVPIDLELCDEVGEVDRDENLVVTACRLHTIKGVDSAIATIDAVRKLHPKVKLQILGDGPLRSSLENEIAERGLREHVSLEGSVTNSVVLQSVAKAAMFLLPCRIGPDGDRDGIPTVLIEAMYLRTPVISTNLSGIPELVTHGREGYLVEPDDIRALEEALVKLLENPLLRSEMGEAARAKVIQEYKSKEKGRALSSGWLSICDSTSIAPSVAREAR